MRKAVKNAKKIPALAQQTGIDEEYLTLLRREVEGYFPKAVPLKEFDWLDATHMQKLEDIYKTNVSIYEALELSDKRSELIENLGINEDFLNHLFSLVDLTRIQWMSPTAARMVLAAGYSSANAVAEADAQQMFETVNQINQQHQFFKGTIGMRDFKRLIQAAGYLQ